MPRVQRKTDTTSSTIAEALKPYLFHGVDFDSDTNEGSGEATGQCPFCTREGKFSVNKETGQWRCLVCGGNEDKGGGGVFTFLRQLWLVSSDSTGVEDYKTFAKFKGLQYPETVIEWELVKSAITGYWLVPGWGLDKSGTRQLQQLYSYRKIKDRMVLLPTPMQRKGSVHTLFGLNLFANAKPEVYICEGPWDAMRLYEVLKNTKQKEDGSLVSTSNQASCLLADINVVAVPGCNTFHKSWATWCKDKHVSLLFDNDHPIQSGNRTAPPAGTEGMKRVTKLVGGVAAGTYYLNWGSEGYDPELPSGYDVRDYLKEEPLTALGTLLDRVTEVDGDWLPAAGESDSEHQIVSQECKSWSKLVLSWRKAMKWIDGLDHALAVMLASISSTQSIGDQLWIKVVGPASCGKSTLCEALSVNKKYVLAKSTIRGFHSGYKTQGSDSGEDNSLLSLLNGKTLITKDGDTLLQSPNLGQILSEARDIYDGVSRTHYRNQMSKDYEGFRLTWLLCGTSSLRSIDSSELGERFLDCVIMDDIDEEVEQDILWRVANKSASHVDIESNCEATSQHSPEEIECKELTGGYIDWLRQNASSVLPTIDFSHAAKHECLRFGKFVAYMRARPSLHQTESGERELAARLVSQHVRLAKCLALVTQEPEVNEKVLKRVRRVCLDTARGVVLDITGAIFNAGHKGLAFPGLTLHVSMGDAELRAMLMFLRDIGVVKFSATKTKRCYKLTPGMSKLYRQVVLER